MEKKTGWEHLLDSERFLKKILLRLQVHFYKIKRIISGEIILYSLAFVLFRLRDYTP